MLKKITLFLGVLSLLVMCTLVPALADTGTISFDPNDESAYPEINVGSGYDFLHTEPASQSAPHKGWWFATLTNYTSTPWSSIRITTGVGDKVAIVKGNNLVDEWGFTANSVVVNRPVTTWNYYTPLGDGFRDYGAPGSPNIGYLYTGVIMNFATPVAANGGKVAVKVYTDNSYYAGPFADSFQLTITPNAAVPEPSSLLALSGSVLGLAGFAWRRRR